jgi:hypothetical protein
MRGDSGGQARLPAENLRFPTLVKIAGLIWVVCGGTILLIGAANLWLSLHPTTAGGARAALVVAFLQLFGLLVGVLFLIVGVRSIRGSAQDTLGNGIGSIGLSLPLLGIGYILFAAAAEVGEPSAALVVTVAALGSLVVIGMLVAGVLALISRAPYKAWRQAANAASARFDDSSSK